MLPLEGAIHDWLGWERGISGTLSLDFPVLAKEERLLGRPRSGRGCQLRAGSGLGRGNKILHLGQAALVPEYGGATRPSPGEHGELEIQPD